ncbi:MAG: hypothetical protein GX967_04040 [Clostridiales bacterium]|nr:hypothetical protein [Clostridiales bacterium]
MEPVLQITSIPISIEISVNPASFEQKVDMPKATMKRNHGGLTIEAEPVQIRIDSFKMRESIGQKSVDTLIKESAEKGIKLSYEGAARVVREGHALAEIHKGNTPASIAKSRAKIARQVNTVMEFIPSTGPDISWSDGKLNINYSVDELEFDWDVQSRADLEFIPAKIEFIIKEKPRVEIEYIGRPLYVPPSADPEYVEPANLDIKG